MSPDSVSLINGPCLRRRSQNWKINFIFSPFSSKQSAISLFYVSSNQNPSAFYWEGGWRRLNGASPVLFSFTRCPEKNKSEGEQRIFEPQGRRLTWTWKEGTAQTCLIRDQKEIAAQVDRNDRKIITPVTAPPPPSFHTTPSLPPNLSLGWRVRGGAEGLLSQGLGV